ncbi:phosphoglycerate kinase [candidate division WOR-3 bacterium]|nr:phosphoglycerate kinase [candidate division WOR-3 bacterium]
MKLEFLTLDDVDFSGKKVLLRGDFNVPLDKKTGAISDDTRIIESLETVKKLLGSRCAVIACSHLGRPKGKTVAEFSLKPVAARFSELLGEQVGFVSECVGKIVIEEVEKLSPGKMIVLENLRFHEEEEKNDPGFSEKLADLADVYVNDAFGTAHRAHSSTQGTAVLFREKSYAVAGCLMKREVEYLTRAMKYFERPVVAIIGGAKITGKIELIENFANFADTILIGGGMVYTFLKSKGRGIGKSILDENAIETAKEIVKKIGKEAQVNFVLPVDSVIVDEIKEGVSTEICDNNEIPDNKIGVDIGPLTGKIFSRAIESAKTIIWNGPMGIFEIGEFSAGTNEIAVAVAKATQNGALSVIGGGDTASAVKSFGMESKYSHISTGGGASLEFMAGLPMPALEALTRRKQ